MFTIKQGNDLCIWRVATRKEAETILKNWKRQDKAGIGGATVKPDDYYKIVEVDE